MSSAAVSYAARARSGGFTLDRALAGRRQASIEMQQGRLKVTPLHAKCPTYILKEGQANLTRATTSVEVGFKDLLVAGTTVIAMQMVTHD